jgi:hypothetical protein
LDHEERLRRYKEYFDDPGFDKYQRSTVRFGFHYEQAVLAWMDELPGILRPEREAQRGTSWTP